MRFYRQKGLEPLKTNIGNEGNVPERIFRYFNTEKDRENFLDGNIWFAGANHNRYFNGDNSDITENRTDMGSLLGNYTLSFSREKIKLDKPTIVIEKENIKNFINSIIETAAQDKVNSHQVSWLDLKKLWSKDSSIDKKLVVPSEKEEILAPLSWIRGAKMIYSDKKLIGDYHSIEAAGLTYHKPIKYEEEKEYRIFISCLLEPNIADIVQYLKIKVNNVRDHCKEA